MLLSDFITGGFSIINKLIEIHKLDEWAKLVLGLALSFVLNGSMAMGVALVAGKSFTLALGLGLCAASGSTWTAFLLNKKSKGIVVAWRTDLEPPPGGYQATEKK